MPREPRGCHRGPILHLRFCSAQAGGCTRFCDAAGQAVGMFGVVLMPGGRPDVLWTGQFPRDALRHPGRHQLAGHGQETTAPGCPAKPGGRAAGPPALQPPTGSAAARGMAAFYHPSLSSPGPLLIAHYSPISGRGSRGTITADVSGSKNARIQATAGNPVTGSKWTAAC